jgi:hypothetical protein
MADIYRIRVKGHLAPRWVELFDGLTITQLDNGDTLLAGPIVDQAALHGMLNRIRDLGMPLLAVERAEPDGAASSDEQNDPR